VEGAAGGAGAGACLGCADDAAPLLLGASTLAGIGTASEVGEAAAGLAAVAGSRRSLRATRFR